jgi:hypothetical protein
MFVWKGDKIGALFLFSSVFTYSSLLDYVEPTKEERRLSKKRRRRLLLVLENS